MWVRPWLLQREERGAYYNIMADLYATDIPGFTNYMRMTPEFFEMIKTRLEPHLSQAGYQLQSTNQCWGEVSPHHQISGHLGSPTHHCPVSSGLEDPPFPSFYQRSAGPSRMSSSEGTSNVLLPQMSGNNWRGNSGSGGMFHMPWEPLMESMWPCRLAHKSLLGVVFFKTMNECILQQSGFYSLSGSRDLCQRPL